MSSPDLPTYSSKAPELEQLNMTSYFQSTSNQAPNTASTLATSYDEEAASLKKHRGGKKLEKDQRKPAGRGGAQSRPMSHHANYSLSLAAGPPDNSNVVLNQSIHKSKVGRVYAYLLTASIVTRWMLFILPLLGLIWVPGILVLTKTYPKASVWGVGLLWWSIWLSVLWGGWWAALAASRIVPIVVRSTLGVVAVSSRKYIDWMYALHRFTAFFAWSVLIWVSYLPVISNRRNPNTAGNSALALDIIGKLLLGSVFCSGILLFEKFSIQWIAGKFHERSYADRIADQKAAVKALVVLYKHSVNVSGVDSLQTEKKGLMFRKLRHHVRIATTTTATVFGNLASEIAGSSVLQPNSPQAIIKTALESPNKSRLLARRIFYSFAKKGAEYLEVEDIERIFPTHEEAFAAFALFDQNNNGDISREEMEAACLGFHREQLSIENSMQNLDSAVGRLDNIFMSVYVIIAILIFAAVLDTHVGALISGAGASFLGLSWLIGGTCQEVLTSIIFLFIKHPFDVGDRVMVKDEYFTVKEIRLLSTTFLDKNATLVIAPNSLLTTQFISNFRRSAKMSETFTFDVSYDTTFQDIERLREKMLEFLKEERRDFDPVFDVTVMDIPGQSKMTLSTDIMYRSNIQHDALKVQRRNKWICVLKATLGELKIYGPAGGPDPGPKVNRYTEVPWEIVERKDREAKEKETQKSLEEETNKPAQDWKLGDKNAVLMDPADEVYGERAEVRMTNPRRGASDNSVGVSTGVAQRPLPASEVFEMKPRSGGA